MWLTQRLGNGWWGTVDAENPSSPPQVTIVGPVSSNPELISTFGRIINGQLRENEDVRFDKPQTWDGTFEYIGVALKNSSINDSTWSIVRVSWILNRRTYMQYRTGIAWTERTQGW